MTEIRWRKSSRSTSGSSCVELAHTRDAVRDSKNLTGPMLSVDLSALLAGVKDERLSR